MKVPVVDAAKLSTTGRSEGLVPNVYHDPSCILKPISSLAYIDRIVINCALRPPAVRVRKLDRLAGSAWVDAGPSGDGLRPYRLTVCQPTRRALRLLARRFRRRDRVTELEIALDGSFATEADAAAFFDWLRHRLRVPHRRGTKHLVRVGEGINETLYHRRRRDRWDRLSIVLYAEASGRVDPRSCVHLEIRLAGRAVGRAGFTSPDDVTRCNALDWLLDHVQLAEVDFAKFGRTILRAEGHRGPLPRIVCERAGRRRAYNLRRRRADNRPDHVTHVADYLRARGIRTRCLRPIDPRSVWSAE